MKTTKKQLEDTLNDFRKEQKNEKTSREVEIILSFGKSAKSFKIQLKEQGFELPKEILKELEDIRIHLLAFKDIGILSQKQLIKCFKKLIKKISKMIVDRLIDETETAKHLGTELVD